jgi:hypothetical protein
VVDDHGDGQLTVPVPWAPTPIAGQVKIVGSNHVEMLDAKLGDVINALSEALRPKVGASRKGIMSFSDSFS